MTSLDDPRGLDGVRLLYADAARRVSDLARQLVPTEREHGRGDYLREALVLGKEVERLTVLAVAAERAQGSTWEVIGDVDGGITKQSAQVKWRRATTVVDADGGVFDPDLLRNLHTGSPAELAEDLDAWYARHVQAGDSIGPVTAADRPVSGYLVDPVTMNSTAVNSAAAAAAVAAASPGPGTGSDATREVIVPDLDGGPPVHVLAVVEEILLTLRGWEDDAALEPGDELELPAPFAHGRALDAVHRVQDVLRGTQNTSAIPGRSGMHGPDGRREHAPLTVIEVCVADVQDLATVARTIGSPRVPEAIEDAVEAMATSYKTTRAEVAEQLARLAGLLDLSWTADADLLAPRIRATACGTHVWLTDAEEAAYGRLADRLNEMASGSGLDRWLY